MALNQSNGSSIPEYVEDFYKKGIAVIENFLSPDEIKQIKEESLKLIEKGAKRGVVARFNVDTGGKVILMRDPDDPFDMDGDDYQMFCADKIRFEWEKKAFDDQWNLILPKEQSINRMGFGLHHNNEVFRAMTCSEKVRQVCRNVDFKDPRIIQTMMIYKQPHIGSELCPHQDATYLTTEPVTKVIGFWFALEDVNLDNGCLWYIPGLHLNDAQPQRFWMRNPDPTTKDAKLMYDTDKPPVDYPADAFVPVTCKAGSCVLIHGLVVHKSEMNRSPNPRPAFTFHLFDQSQVQWSKKSWIQPTEERPFMSVYNDEPVN